MYWPTFGDWQDLQSVQQNLPFPSSNIQLKCIGTCDNKTIGNIVYFRKHTVSLQSHSSCNIVRRQYILCWVQQNISEQIPYTRQIIDYAGEVKKIKKTFLKLNTSSEYKTNITLWRLKSVMTISAAFVSRRKDLHDKKN